MNYFKGEKEFFPGIGKIEFEKWIICFSFIG